MVSIAQDTKLFTEDNIKKFAENGSHLIYGIVGHIPGPADEYSTMAICLTPSAASDMCEQMMGEAIEIWVIDRVVGIHSEKWEPKYFKNHFEDIVGVSYHRLEEDDENNDEDDEDDSEDTDNPSFDITGIAHSPENILNCALIEILKAQEEIFKITATASFATGHPIDIENLLKTLQNDVSKIIYALTFSKGGYEPKIKELSDGSGIPYWTKRQIDSAKIDPENR